MNHTLLRLVVFSLYRDESKAVKMLRRRKIHPSGDDISAVDAEQLKGCIEHLTPYLLPWFIPYSLARVLPKALCSLISNIGFLSRLDILDNDYYAKSAHGTASIDFIIHTVDKMTLLDRPPPLRRSCTGWYSTSCADVSMTTAERTWLQTQTCKS